MSITPRSSQQRNVDARGVRFSASLTALVLAVALVLANPALVVIQGAVFAIGALLGPHRSPYSLLFRRVIAPRLYSPAEPEPIAPPQFAQSVGLLFVLLALVGALLSSPLFVIATGLAFAAALVNAAFGYCLGCQMYLLIARTRRRLIPAK